MQRFVCLSQPVSCAQLLRLNKLSGTGVSDPKPPLTNIDNEAYTSV